MTQKQPLQAVSFVREFFGDIRTTYPIDLGWVTPKNLPVWMKHAASYFRFPLKETFVTLIIPKEDVDFEQTINLYRVFQRLEQGTALILADNLPNRSRGGLVHMGIPHVVSDTAIYAPQLGISYKQLRAAPSIYESRERLLPLGLKMVAWYLLMPRLLSGPLTLLALQKLTVESNYPISLSTLSRAFRQLEEFELIRISGGGRTRSLHFEERLSLWKKLSQLEIETVVRTVDEFYDPPEDLTWVYSSDSALAETTELNKPKITTIATSIFNYRKWKEDRQRHQARGNWGEPVLTIELWREDPAFLAQNRCLNPIELALSLRKENDPRIRLAVNEMLKKYELPWIPEDHS